MKNKPITADEFDRLFDSGSDAIDAHVDWETPQKPISAMKRVNTDFPLWMVRSLDKEAERLGVARQSLIKMWISEKLEQVAK